jgi:hypothetical protein
MVVPTFEPDGDVDADVLNACCMAIQVAIGASNRYSVLPGNRTSTSSSQPIRSTAPPRNENPWPMRAPPVELWLQVFGPKLRHWRDRQLEQRIHDLRVFPRPGQPASGLIDRLVIVGVFNPGFQRITVGARGRAW